MRAPAITLAAVALTLGCQNSAEAARPAAGIDDVVVGADAKAKVGRIFVVWSATCTGRIHHLRGIFRGDPLVSQSSGRPTHRGPEPEPVLVYPPQRLETWFSARRHSAYGWTGVFEAKIAVLRGEKVVARCHVPRTSWSATAPRARLSFVADLAQPFFGPHPQRVSLSTPRNALWISGTDNELDVHFGEDFRDEDFDLGWSVDITAPGRRPLRVGRYRNAMDQTVLGTHPDIDFAGRRDGKVLCSQPTGEFTVRAIAFTRFHQVKTLDTSFVVRCGGPGTQPIRGSFTYRR